jgi:hypothetical protein
VLRLFAKLSCCFYLLCNAAKYNHDFTKTFFGGN